MSYGLNSSTTSRRSCLIDLAHGRHLILDSLTKSLTYMKVEQWTKSPQSGLPPKLPHVSKSKQIQSQVSWFSVPELFWECYTSSIHTCCDPIRSDLVWWRGGCGGFVTPGKRVNSHLESDPDAEPCACHLLPSQAAHLEWMLHIVISVHPSEIVKVSTYQKKRGGEKPPQPDIY